MKKILLLFTFIICGFSLLSNAQDVPAATCDYTTVGAEAPETTSVCLNGTLTLNSDPGTGAPNYAYVITDPTNVILDADTGEPVGEAILGTVEETPLGSGSFVLDPSNYGLEIGQTVSITGFGFDLENVNTIIAGVYINGLCTLAIPCTNDGDPSNDFCQSCADAPVAPDAFTTLEELFSFAGGIAGGETSIQGVLGVINLITDLSAVLGVPAPCYSINDYYEYSVDVVEDAVCAPPCTAIGGNISTMSPTTFCVGDGEDDLVGVDLEGNAGENTAWVITAEDGTILDLPAAPPFNFDGAPSGVCLIWSLSWDGDLAGAEVGANAGDLAGDCFDLSNPIEVTRLGPEDPECAPLCTALGGEISTDDNTTFCVGDGVADLVSATVDGNAGENTAWVITDEDLNILDIPAGPPFDFDGAPAGVCLIWALSWDGDLAGAEVGANAGDLAGDCFALSNSIAVTRLGADDPDCAQAVAGCTNPVACNFDAAATEDDGSCALIGDPCGAGGILDVNCECLLPECEAAAGSISTVFAEFYCAEDESTVSISSTGFNADAIYVQAYVLTSGSQFTIVGLSFDGSFDTPGPGTYNLHALNIAAGEVPTDLGAIIGVNAGDVLAGVACYDLATSTSTFTVLNPITILLSDYDCNIETGIATLSVSYDGGFPEFQGAGTYNASGDINGLVDYGETYILDFTDNSEVFFSATDDLGCFASSEEDFGSCLKNAVELTNFNGTIENNGNKIIWSTSTEFESEAFILEKATDARGFETIGEVKSSVNSNVTLDYSFLDTEVTYGTAYYRLSERSIDGTVKIVSDVISLNRKSDLSGLIEIAPIPAQNFVNINYGVSQEGEIVFSVYDITGKQIDLIRVNAELGLNNMNLDITDYAIGNYFLQMSYAGEQKTARFVKDK